ncbi:MAG: C-GCAxxG-C-C family protein [Fibrobacteraceae bacterium]|nr:C-GCAxxG-C-C family protein [Fibrobacteraceae bacterium]
MDFHSKHLGNCAESVGAAFAEEHKNSEASVKAFASCGGGRAPGGLCGALYAAISLNSEAKDEIIKRFAAATGGTLCREIRPKKEMTCTDRVGIAAGILDSLEKR